MKHYQVISTFALRCYPACRTLRKKKPVVLGTFTKFPLDTLQTYIVESLT